MRPAAPRPSRWSFRPPAPAQRSSSPPTPTPQDWNYVVGGAMSITLELSEEKWRPEADLPALWHDNKDALPALALAAALGGARQHLKGVCDR